MTDASMRVEGPLRGGARGYPHSASIVDLGPYGYTEDDYALSGTATPFAPAPGTELGVDGRWQVLAGDEQPYRTRLLIRRPPADRFNGTVIVEFMQEYFGSERDTNYRWNAEAILREGFAWVGASLHRAGVDEPGGQEIAWGEVSLVTGPPLVEWDPGRYAGLTIPHTDLCYDILSDVARAVGPDRPGVPVDPLAGLPVRRVMAVGNTIAATRLEHYHNAVQPLHGLFDAFYLQDLVENGTELAEGITPQTGHSIRADLDVPVIVMNTMTAVVEEHRQPPGPTVRFWEPAGSSHTTGPYMAQTAADAKRQGVDMPVCPEDYANTLPVQYVSSAAIVALHRWASGGDSAPAFPLLDRTGEPPETELVLDEVGNAVGGLRTPWVDVPIARYDWQGECLGGAGRTYPLPPEQLFERYGTPDAYRIQFEAAVREAEARGVLLSEDARQAVADAGQVGW